MLGWVNFQFGKSRFTPFSNFSLKYEMRGNDETRHNFLDIHIYKQRIFLNITNWVKGEVSNNNLWDIEVGMKWSFCKESMKWKKGGNKWKLYKRVGKYVMFVKCDLFSIKNVLSHWENIFGNIVLFSLHPFEPMLDVWVSLYNYFWFVPILLSLLVTMLWNKGGQTFHKQVYFISIAGA